MADGLFTTLTNVNFDDASIKRFTDRVRAMRRRLDSPGSERKERFIAPLWEGDTDTVSLRSTLLFGLKGMAAYAHHAARLGFQQIAFRPAVEISYLSEGQQYTLLEAMSYNDATPSLAQAIKMKKFMQEGKLTDEVISSIMEEEKPNQREKPAFRDERITKLIPKSIPRGQETDFVVKALEFYNRHLQRNKAHER